MLYGVELVNLHIFISSLLGFARSTPPPFLVSLPHIRFSRFSLGKASQFVDSEVLELDHQGSKG